MLLFFYDKIICDILFIEYNSSESIVFDTQALKNVKSLDIQSLRFFSNCCIFIYYLKVKMSITYKTMVNF